MSSHKSAPGAVPVAPDGGWGWMVLVGASVAYFLADGWSFSFGVLFPSLLENFEEGKGKTALIAALLYGVPMLLSPIVCALTTCYGSRIVAVCGGIFTSAAILLSAFATSVDFLCASIGLFASVGLVMTYIPGLFIVTFYFDKRRGLATGLAMIGSGLGSILFPPLMDTLCVTYSWRGFLLITSALCLHMIAAGLLYRPLPMSSSNNALDEPTLQHAQSCADLYCDGIPSITKRNSRQQPDDLSDRLYSASSPELGVDTNQSALELSATSVVEMRDPSSHCGRLRNELHTLLKTMLDKSLATNWAFLLFCGSNFILYLWVGVPYIFLIDRALELEVAGATKLYFLSSVIGIGRTVGQVVLGYIGDNPRVNSNVLYGVCVVVIGVDTLFVPLCTSYASLCVYAVVFGLFVSVTYALQMICVVDIVGLERATSAFGLLQFLQGIATILGTPLAGWLYDRTGAYDPTFYTSGAWMALAGVMLMPLPWVITDQSRQL